ncbi:MAG: NHL repeat-containing protein, partial [Planctomycetota bacterium]
MSPKALLALMLSVCLLSIAPCFGADDKEAPHIVPVPELEALDSTLGTHVEIEPIGASDESGFANLTTFCLTEKDNILACDAKSKEIRVMDPFGKKLGAWKLDFGPYAIHSCKSGQVFVGGTGIVAKLDKTGKLIKKVDTEKNGLPDAMTSGIAVFEEDVFVAFGTEGSLRSRSSIVRFNRDLTEQVVIAEELRGCCKRLDMVACKDGLYVAENSRHRVLKLDKQGKVLDKWGERDRVNVEGFGSCCNPMNLYYSPKGWLYTA